MDTKKIFLLISLSWTINSLISAQTEIFLTNALSQKIQKINLNDKEVKDIVASNNRIADPKLVHIPKNSNEIYWSNSYGLDLNRTRPFGRTTQTDTEILFEHHIPTNDYAFDIDGAQIFWVNNEGLYKGNITTRTQEQVVSQQRDFSITYNIIIDTLAGKFYWITGLTGKIQRANLDGSELEDIVAESGRITSMCLDFTHQRIYWTNLHNEKIQAINVDGSDKTTIAEEVSLLSPLQLDEVTEKLYWLDVTEEAVIRVNTNGQNRQLTATNLISPNLLKIVPKLNKMFWVDYGINAIYKANLDGSNKEVITDEIYNPSELVLDAENQKIYWSDINQHKIIEANLDGTDVKDLVIDIHTPRSLVLDSKHQKIYWSETNGNKIQSVNLDGSGLANIITNSSAAYTMQFDWSAQKMYWSDSRTDRIIKADLNGANQKILFQNAINFPSHIVYDKKEQIIFWFDDGTDRLYKVKAGQAVEEVLQIDGKLMSLIYNEIDERLYWISISSINGELIQSANKDGTDLKTLVDDLASPNYLQIDNSTGKMYWTSRTLKSIFRANLDGSPTTEKLYWVKNGYDMIQSANLDGTENEIFKYNKLGQPLGITLDDQEQKLYWVDKGYNRIQSSNLDGTELENIITDQDTPLDPVDIALDKENQKIYWTNYRQNNIQVADKNGGNIQIVIKQEGKPDGIALSENRIFWSVVNEGKIKSATLTGTDIQDVVQAIGYPQDIVIDKFANQIYWIDFQNKIIERADFNGLNRETIISENVPIAAMDIDLENGQLYWTTLGANATLFRANLDGREIEVIQEDIESGNGIVIYNQAQTTSVQDLYTEELSIYPNPVQDILTIEFQESNAPIESIKLTNTEGKTLLKRDSIINNQPIFLDVQHLNQGFYFLEVNSANGKLTKKILKQ